MKYYAGIGSRETPHNICNFIEWVARKLAEREWILRSGGAEGADLAFERAYTETYRKHPACKEIYTTEIHLPMWTGVFVDHFHPAPDRLKPFPRKLMQRNAMQVLGSDGDTPVEFVICWTKDGGPSGGTGQAIRVANYYNIPVFNLFYEETREKIERKLGENNDKHNDN